jgi:hypothetical protein
VLSAAGKRVAQEVVATNGHVLVEFLRQQRGALQ